MSNAHVAENKLPENQVHPAGVERIYFDSIWFRLYTHLLTERCSIKSFFNYFLMEVRL